MNKFCLVLGILFLSKGYVNAQDATDPINGRNEVKVNMFNLVVLKYLDASYERVVDEESSYGIAGLINLGQDYSTFDDVRDFSITPYYRRYFSKGYAKGFFVEGFGMLNQSLDETYSNYDEIAQEYTYITENYTDFAIGVSLGGKFISKKGFVAEVYGGIGRNLFNPDNPVEVVGRGGISLGFRF